MTAQHNSGVVLAMGSGGARGMAHIGVLRALEEADIPVRAIVGSSIGAEIGALYAAGMTASEMFHLARDFDWKTTLKLFMPEFGNGGIITDKGIRNFLSPFLTAKTIESLTIGYAAVATDLQTGEQVIFNEGDLLEAVRASISLPGLLPPAKHHGHMLSDGGLVNPVPFDVARQLFGGPVIAVAVHPGANPAMMEDDLEQNSEDWRDRLESLVKQSVAEKFPAVEQWLQLWDDKEQPSALPDWGVGEIYSRAMDISRAQLMRLRDSISPPDLYIKPAVQHISMLEFYHADQAIEAGQQAALAQIGHIRELLDSLR